MTAEPNTLLRPSDDLDELRGQLIREMNLLDGQPDGEEPELFRAYLHHAQAKAWQRVAEGRMNAPRTVLGLLECARPFIDVHLPDLAGAAAAAAEVHFAIESLHVAVEALEERRVEDRLAKEPSGTERAILRVLAGNRARYLRRGDVHGRLDPADRPTPARVGQILVELADRGLLLRIHGRAQGSPNAAFYALSARGLEICGNLGLIPEPEPEEVEPGPTEAQRIHEVAGIAVDPDRSPTERRIASGSLSSYSIRTHKLFVLKVLKDRAQGSSHPLARELYGNVLHELEEASRVNAVEEDGHGTINVA